MNRAQLNRGALLCLSCLVIVGAEGASDNSSLFLQQPFDHKVIFFCIYWREWFTPHSENVAVCNEDRFLKRLTFIFPFPPLSIANLLLIMQLYIKDPFKILLLAWVLIDCTTTWSPKGWLGQRQICIFKKTRHSWPCKMWKTDWKSTWITREFISQWEHAFSLFLHAIDQQKVVRERVCGIGKPKINQQQQPRGTLHFVTCVWSKPGH